MWYHQSKVGLIRIFFNGKNYTLEIDDNVYGYYSRADLAADDVAMFTTGCYEWDSLEGHIHNFPGDLSEWERMK